MKYKLVIFDFDGTLADTYPWFISITNKIADKFQLKRVDPNEVDTLKGYSAMKVIKTL